MRLYRFAGICVLFLPVVALTPAHLRAQELPPAERYHLRGEYWRWEVNLDSQLQKGFGTEPGTVIDGTDTLGLTGGGTNVIRATIRFGQSAKLRGSWTQIDFMGDQDSPTNFTFGDEIFFAGDRVVTRVKGGLYSAEFEYDFVKRKEGYMGVFLGAVYLDSDSVLVSPGSGRQVAQTGQVGCPIIGISGRTYYGKRFSFEGEFGGGTIGSRGNVWVVNFTVRLHLSDRLAAVGGYRRLSMHGQNDRDSVDVKMTGWVFGGEFSL
jgi:hypothetical protein